MAKGIVASKRGDWAAVIQTVERVFDRQQFNLLAEPADAMRPWLFQPATQLDGAAGPRGRAFNQRVEVRWRQTACGSYIVTYLSEQDEPPPGTGLAKAALAWEITASRQKLYGKWSDDTNDWIEVSVPGVTGAYLTFDLPAYNSLQLDTVDYSLNGVIQMTRFRDISEYQPR